MRADRRALSRGPRSNRPSADGFVGAHARVFVENAVSDSRRIGEKDPSRQVKKVQCPRSVESHLTLVIPAQAGIYLMWTPAFAGVTTTFVALGGAKGPCPLG